MGAASKCGWCGTVTAEPLAGSPADVPVCGRAVGAGPMTVAGPDVGVRDAGSAAVVGVVGRATGDVTGGNPGSSSETPSPPPGPSGGSATCRPSPGERLTVGGVATRPGTVTGGSVIGGSGSAGGTPGAPRTSAAAPAPTPQDQRRARRDITGRFSPRAQCNEIPVQIPRALGKGDVRHSLPGGSRCTEAADG